MTETTQNSEENQKPKIVKLSKESCRKNAQAFNIGSIIAVLTGWLIIPMILWIAGSIYVHARAGHHPDQRVCNYNLQAGYRFYGTIGFLTLAVPITSGFFDDKWLFYGGVYVILILAVVPLGIRDILRAKNENWVDMEVSEEDYS